ncbi:hypothetical protein [Emticicia fontis]
MDLKTFAKKIDGKQSEEWESTDDMHQEAQKAGFVIVYIALDVEDHQESIIMFEGAIRTDFPCYADEEDDEMTMDFTKNGDWLGDEELSILTHHNRNFKYNTIQILYNWFDSDTSQKVKWQVIAVDNIPFEKFNIYQGEELFCIGLVFNFTDFN